MSDAHSESGVESQRPRKRRPGGFWTRASTEDLFKDGKPEEGKPVPFLESIKHLKAEFTEAEFHRRVRMDSTWFANWERPRTRTAHTASLATIVAVSDRTPEELGLPTSTCNRVTDFIVAHLHDFALWCRRCLNTPNSMERGEVSPPGFMSWSWLANKAVTPEVASQLGPEVLAGVTPRCGMRVEPPRQYVGGDYADHLELINLFPSKDAWADVAKYDGTYVVKLKFLGPYSWTTDNPGDGVGFLITDAIPVFGKSERRERPAF